VSRSEGDSESYSRDVKDGAVQLLLPELLAVSVG
jgi:hypothetical protein